MKKIVSLLLAFVLIFSLCVPAFATVDIFKRSSKVPVIIISGDGSTIVDKDDKPLSKLTRFTDNKNEGGGDEVDSDEITQSVMNVMRPFLNAAIVTGDWEPYYENLEKEMRELFGDIILDENGEASNGSHLAVAHQNRTIKDTQTNYAHADGTFSMGAYHFYYDWRLDPCVSADEFYDYIQAVKKVTGIDKVAIVAHCIGSNVLCAYLQKYGTDDLVGVGFDGLTCNGVEPLSEAISGKFKVDGYALERLIADVEAFGYLSLSSFVKSSIDLAVKSGALDGLTNTVKYTVYEKIAAGVTSAVTLAAVSYPNYWATVSVEDFDTAVEYVFGPEGSEKRVKYAGLIEKITNYNETVKKHIPEMMESLKGKINVGVISKYGTQLVSTCESRDKIGDSFASVEKSSFGATCGTVYATLSDEYIASQTEKGLDKYISPDKLIDASTCIFPDSTWFVKGVRHSEWTKFEDQLLYTVVSADHQLTVEEVGWTQFVVPKTAGDYSEFVPMTADNNKVENWDADTQAEDQSNFVTKLLAFMNAFEKWFQDFINVLLQKMSEWETSSVLSGLQSIPLD